MTKRLIQCTCVLALLITFNFGITACTQSKPLPTIVQDIPTVTQNAPTTEDLVPKNTTEEITQDSSLSEPTSEDTETPPEPTKLPTKMVKITPATTSTPFPRIEPSAIKPEQDIYFLSSGELRMWSSQTGEVTTVIQAQATQRTPDTTFTSTQGGRVADYRLLEKKQQIVMLRSRGIAANGVELFDIEFVDLATGTYKVLNEETPAVYHLGISPDGEWITYISQPQGGGPIFSLKTTEISEPVKIGICQAETEYDCQEIVWLEEQNSVMWNDSGGVWLSSPPNFEPIRIIENHVSIIDLDGNERDLEVNFSRLRWSPLGRYILADIHPTRSEIHWQGIIDTLRGKVIEIPDTYEFDEPAAVAEWMPGGDLLVTHVNVDGSDYKLQITKYNVLPTSESLLVPEQEFVLGINVGEEELVEGTDVVRFAPQLVYLESDRIVWVVFGNPQSEIRSKLYQADLKYRLVTGNYDLPQDETQYHWSPYSAEAILVIRTEEIYYFSQKEQAVYDITQVFDVSSCCFQWMP